MDLSKIKVIIGREYSVRVKKKSFILTTILTPILFALLMAVPMLIMLYGGGDSKIVKIADESGLMSESFENSSKVEYQFVEGYSLDELKSRFDALNCYAVIGISALDSNKNVSIVSYSKEPLNAEIKSSVANAVNRRLEDYKLGLYNIDNLGEIMKSVKTNVRVEALTLTEDGKEKKESVEIYMALSYIMSFLIYMFVFMFGTMVMRGVIEEKETRIIEVIVSSVKPFELMMGKIIGVALVALTQFVIWIGLTAALVIGITSAAGINLNISSDSMSQITQMAPSPVTGSEDVAKVVESINSASATGAMDSEDAALFDGILQQIAQIDFGYVLLCFLVYFLLGYLLYAAMFAAVGSAVDNEADTQQLSIPITIPLILGLFIMLSTFQDPNSSLSVWASMIPFTSPMVMLARIPFGVVPMWQLLLSIALLLVTFIGIVYISAKIYQVGILTFGKKASFKDLYKWIKSKN